MGDIVPEVGPPRAAAFPQNAQHVQLLQWGTACEVDQRAAQEQRVLFLCQACIHAYPLTSHSLVPISGRQLSPETLHLQAFLLLHRKRGSPPADGDLGQACRSLLLCCLGPLKQAKHTM